MANQECSYVERLIYSIDPKLTYLGDLGDGSFSKVVKVGMLGEEYALKIARGTKNKSIAYEFNIQKALEGIVGVPEAIKLYDNAFIMQYIPGKDLSLCRDVPEEFFTDLSNIFRTIHIRGYMIPTDMHSGNIIVDEKNKPWVVDFMFAEKLTVDNYRDSMSYAKECVETMKKTYGRKC